jgi:hypothetical protein
MREDQSCYPMIVPIRVSIRAAPSASDRADGNAKWPLASRSVVMYPGLSATSITRWMNDRLASHEADLPRALAAAQRSLASLS